MSKELACQKAVDLSAMGRVTDLWRDFGPSSARKSPRCAGCYANGTHYSVYRRSDKVVMLKIGTPCPGKAEDKVAVFKVFA